MRPLFVTMLLLGVSSAAAATAPTTETCDDVGGKFTSVLDTACETSPIGMCTRGALQGNLAGAYAMTFTSLEPTSDPTQFHYTGTSTITLDNGEAIYTEEVGILIMTATGSTFQTVASVFTGTSVFTEASGGFTAEGVIDPATGLTNGKYKGEICLTCELGSKSGGSCLTALKGG